MARSFDKFNKVLNVYMPPTGEGDTVASQIATAVAKIAYRWFNDGDTISNTIRPPNGTDCGGVAQFANWLNANVPEAKRFFDTWTSRFFGESDYITNNDYEKFLYQMCENLLNPDLLDGYSDEPKRDTIYSLEWETGRFHTEDDYDNFEE